jgi:alpha-2-macroglobulin
MSRTRPRSLLLVLLVLGSALAGCRGCGGPSTATPGPAASPGAGVREREEGGAAPALTPEALAPVLRERATPGELPDAIVIELARDAAPDGKIGALAEGTTLEVSPPVKGALRWRGPSTLEFRPDEPFAHGRSYDVALARVSTRDGVVAAPREGWTHRFTAPPFSFVRLGLERLVPGNRAEVNVVFSGPVRPGDAERHLAWTAGDGRALQPLRTSNTEAPNVIRVTLPAAATGSAIRLAVTEGIASARDRRHVAPAARAELVVPDGPPLTIHSASLHEGNGGFYVEVVCDDAAVAGGKRWYWDAPEREHRQLSRRCVLSEEDAARAIRFTPPVKASVAPGPAGFRVFGDFARGPGSLAIEAGARSLDGGVVFERFEQTFSVPARRPQLAFATGGRYLPRSAWKSLPIAHLNVERAELSIRLVRPENLVFWLSGDDERATDRTSDLLLRKTVFLRGAPEALATTWVDVASMLPATTRGVLELTVEGAGARATARLLLTDLNLVAKRSAVPKERWRQQVRVWALDMETTALVSGVDVTVLRKSGRALATCSTSGANGCLLEVGRDDADDAEPFALVARKGDDLTYVRYDDLRTDTSDSDVAGVPFAAEEAYRAALWTDRGVYRPGDVAHATALVRDRAHAAPPAGMPVELQLIDPRQKTVRKLALKANEAGLVSVDLPFAAFADTGRWQLVASVAGRRVGEHVFNVEEFVPERMKVTAQADRPAYLLGDVAAVTVGARYLFGGSAEGSRVELTCALEPAPFRPRENGNFTYGPQPGRADGKGVTLGSATGTLGKDGSAGIACPPSTGAFAGPARLVAAAAVFEAGGGRSTVGEARAAVHPERFYLGLDSPVRKAEVGKVLPVKGVVVDWNGALAPTAAKEIALELVRLEPEYGFWWDEAEGGERFERQLRPVSEGSVTVAATGGRFVAELRPREGGAAYLVRARAGGATTELRVEGEERGFDWWGGGEDRAETTPRPLKPTAIPLTVPAAIRVGAKATAKLVAPFRGRALLTVETDRVIASEWRAVEAGEIAFDFTVPEFAPNVYVSALVVKDPHLESSAAYLPDRAFGVVSAPIEPVAFTAPLSLRAPAEVRSNAPLAVTLDVGKVEGPTFAVVAAVDEGILQLTRMKSPDPLATLFAKRALGVDTFETIGWTLLVPPQGPSRATGGGDDGEAGAGRVQPVKPVALWSGVVPVGADGKVEVRFAVPQYRGQLRVMAVTAGPRRIGRAEASVTVKDPLVLQATLPRFLVQGDEAQIPIFVTNVSGAARDVRVSLAAEALPVPGMAAGSDATPPLTFLGRTEGTARLADGASSTFVFRVKTAIAVGAAKLRVTARAGDLVSHEELDVPIQPAGPRERIVRRLEIAGGTVDLRPALEGWVPTSERSTFWLTANPYGETFDHLKYLVHYPYGCVEQTTSSARPLLHVANLLDRVDPELTAGGRLEDLVAAGIHRLLAMQTPSGGLAYWPGGTEPAAWGTAYATHFLLDARKLGYAVPQDRLEDVLRWMEGQVAAIERGEKRDDGYSSTAGTEAYLHYVLALAGRPHKARVQRLVELLPAKRDGAALERKVLLEAALWLAGDRRYERELKSPDLSAISEERRNDWTFYSDRRRRGLTLAILEDLFPRDAALEPLAQRVAESLARPSHHYTTQELVWGVTGLGKRIAAVAPADAGAARLVANGKEVAPRPARARAGDRAWGIARASELARLVLEAGAPGAGPRWLVVSSEGVREDPDAKLGGSGLRITRTFRDLAGATVDPRAAPTPLAGLLFVELTVRNTSGERIQNVALVDRIPAGFEVENPRLGRGGGADWIDPAALWRPDFLDVRDDRISVFGALEAGETRKVVYAVRAVTAGRFTLPPVEAEAMYDPSRWAREGGGEVEVASPWKDSLL